MTLQLPTGARQKPPPTDADLRVAEALGAHGITAIIVTLDPDRGVIADVDGNGMAKLATQVLPDAAAEGWLTVSPCDRRYVFDLSAVLDGFAVTLRYNSPHLPPALIVGYWPDAMGDWRGAK